MRSYRVLTIDHPVAAGLLMSAALAQLFACASPASVPARDPISQPAANLPVPSPAPADTPTITPPATTRPCRNGERLDSGCECHNGACFDICCGPGADCAHPASPGGPSACMLQVPTSPAPTATPEPAKACTDGELLAHGCTCEGTRCMDLCCVGSVCRHHSSPEGGWAKCMTQPR